MQKGVLKGVEENKRETARKMIAAGTFTNEQIAAFSGLNLREIEELSKTDGALN